MRQPDVSDVAGATYVVDVHWRARVTTTTMSTSPTVLSHLHTLLTTLRQQAPLPYAPFLHPYAPTGKGKGRDDGRDVSRLFRELRDGIEGVRVVLGGDGSLPVDGDRERERTRLTRVMKELATHQAALLPLLSNLGNLPVASSSTVPFAVAPLPPAQLLIALGQSVSLDCFSEPSQFGMQGDSLLLAGKSVVIDIELESAQPDGDAPSSSKVQEGSVKLAKVNFSHATAEGETIKSDRIQRLLESRIEAVLAVWNGDDQGSESRELRLARAVESLKHELEDIVVLDDLTAQGRDWLSDVDVLHAGLDSLITISGESNEFAMYPPSSPSVLPTFHLLRVDHPSARVQLRPAASALSPFAPLENAAIATIDSNAAVWAGWSLEISPVVVSPSFFPADGSAPTFAPYGDNLAIEDLMFTPPDAFIPRMPFGTHHMPSPFSSFPFDSDNLFLHEATRTQLWSLSSNRPEGYVVGRFGVGSWAAVAALAKALTPAVVLEQLFRSVFTRTAQSRAANRARAEDSDDDELATFLQDDGASDLAVTASLGLNTFILSFPVGSQTHTIELEAMSVPPFVRAPDDVNVLAPSGLVTIVSNADKRPSSKRKRSDASDEPEKKARV